METVGKFTYGYETAVLRVWPEGRSSDIVIGKFCSIADNVMFFLGGNHRKERVTTYPFGYKYNEIFPNAKKVEEPHSISRGNIVIGNDVWIASGASIMSGVTIKDGAIIAANSHVVKDVYPYEMVGGNPAKHINFRFNPEQIEELLTIKWWDWESEKINKLVELLCSDDIDEFIKQAKLT
jgi:acetyltransferase-like isoleucine patch superfamily enzyme